MKSEPTFRRVARGFTLVELLVVVAIISVLISVLLPALHKAREQALNVACESNLRQMGAAVQIYVDQDQGYLPYGYCPFYNENNAALGTDVNYGNWSLLLTAALRGGSGEEFDTTWYNATLPFRTALFTDGDSIPVPNGSHYLDYLCHPRLMPFFQYGNTANTSPSVDDYLESLPGAVPYPQYPFYKLTQVKQQNTTAMIFDGTQDFLYSGGNTDSVGKNIDNAEIQSGGGYLIRSLTNNYTITHFVVGTNQDCFSASNYAFQASNLRFRHLDNTLGNVLFADLHVESERYSPTSCDLGLQNFLVDPP